MTDVETLVAFLRARLDEREQLAQAAKGDWPGQAPRSGVWSYVETPGGDRKVVDDLGYTVSGHYDVDSQPWDTEPHIAANDPRYVRDDLAAKRRILDAYDADDNYDRYGGCGDGCEWKALGYAIGLFALPFASHPDYRQEWRP